MRFYARTQSLAALSIAQCLQVIKELGFDGAEVCLEHADLRPEKLDDALIRSVRHALENSGLASWSVSYHGDYTYDDALYADTLAAIPRVRDFGAEVFVFSGGRRRTGDLAEWRKMVQRTRELVALAEQHDVILAKEFEPGFVVGSTEELLQLFEEIPSPNLAANADLGHLFLCDPDPLAAIRALAGKIVHGHVENMRAGVHKHLLPQDGDMDLPSYLTTLEKVGFEGPLALDLYDMDYQAVSGPALAYLRAIAPRGPSKTKE